MIRAAPVGRMSQQSALHRYFFACNHSTSGVGGRTKRHTAVTAMRTCTRTRPHFRHASIQDRVNERHEQNTAAANSRLDPSRRKLSGVVRAVGQFSSRRRSGGRDHRLRSRDASRDQRRRGAVLPAFRSDIDYVISSLGSPDLRTCRAAAADDDDDDDG